jgi:hypothetical protein
MKRLLVATVVSAILAVGVGRSPAAAAPPAREFRGTQTDTFEEVLCGVAVTTTIENTGAFTFFFDQDGNVTRAQGTGTFRATSTNAEGESITVFAANRFEGTATENPDGTVTFVDTFTGLPERITDAEGNVLTADVGNIVFTTTVDFGDPEDPTDDQIVFEEISFEAGRHPEAESDFALFCEIVTEQLG